MHALVVDDSRSMRLILAKHLVGLGFDVSEAANGQEALMFLAQNSVPDLMLLDWNMPEMNGLQCLQAVRSDPRHASMQVVMVTTEQEMENVSTALEHGANEYIMKPFTEEIFQEKLRLLELPLAG